MEEEEVGHIQANMHTLIEHTNVNEVLLLRLSAAGVLSEPDIDDVVSTLAIFLFEILLKLCSIESKHACVFSEKHFEKRGKS